MNQSLSKAPPRAGAVWLPAEEELLQRRFADGWQLKALMVAHGRAANAITSRLVKLGLLVNYGRVYYPVAQDPWTTQEEIAYATEQIALDL